MGSVVVIVVRLALPLVILRRPLLGGVLAFLADAADLVAFNIWGFPTWVDYQQLDKVLDLYYLLLELVVAQRWTPWRRTVANGLFGWRVIGVVLFEATGARWVLLLFPNVFELFWLLVVAADRFRPGGLRPRAAAVWLPALLAVKLAHEYVLHVWRVLDRYVLADLVRGIWPG